MIGNGNFEDLSGRHSGYSWNWRWQWNLSFPSDVNTD